MNTINAEEILIPLIKCRCRSFSRIFPAQTQSPIQTRSHLATKPLYYSGLAEVKRVEKRRIIDLRDKVGTKGCIVGKIVKSQMKGAGHMTRMKDERLQNISETKKQDCCKKTRKTKAKLGGLCEERPEKNRGGRKVGRTDQQQGPMETDYKSSRTSECQLDLTRFNKIAIQGIPQMAVD